jgi:hypothetical protein
MGFLAPETLCELAGVRLPDFIREPTLLSLRVDQWSRNITFSRLTPPSAVWKHPMRLEI